MRGKRLLATAMCVGLMVAPAFAHHSMAAYDQTTLVAINGTVTAIEWRNPHTWVTLSVQNADGSTITQRIEIGGPAGLERRSFTKDLLNIGDSVTVEAWLPKNARETATSGRWITLADSRRFDVGDNWLQNAPR